MPNVKISPAPVSKTAVIVLSWPCKSDKSVIDMLPSGCKIENPHTHTYESIMLYSFFKFLEFKLSGNPLDIIRSKCAEGKLDVQKITPSWYGKQNLTSVLLEKCWD